MATPQTSSRHRPHGAAWGSPPTARGRLGFAPDRTGPPGVRPRPHGAAWGSPPTGSAGSVGTWVACFPAVDFGYCRFHRPNHEIDFPRAAHVVHYQSEEYNLAVALRRCTLQPFMSAICYLPLAASGHRRFKLRFPLGPISRASGTDQTPVRASLSSQGHTSDKFALAA
jgi:hypothetical protein